MLDIRITKKTGYISQIEIKGHTYFDKKGKDIVCSAVSVLFINTMNSIEAFTEDKAKVEKKGRGESQRVIAEFAKEPSKEAKLLLDSMLLGFRQIIDTYGKTYVSMEILEV